MALCICINYFYPSMLVLPLVNFNIIVRKHFLYKSASHSFSLITVRIFIFGAKILAQNASVKCWWNWHQVSISSTLYARIFRTNVFLAAFYVHTYVEKSCRKDNVRTKNSYVKCWWNWRLFYFVYYFEASTLKQFQYNGILFHYIMSFQHFGAFL